MTKFFCWHGQGGTFIEVFMVLGITACSPQEDLGYLRVYYSTAGLRACYVTLRTSINPTLRHARIETTPAPPPAVYGWATSNANASGLFHSGCVPQSALCRLQPASSGGGLAKSSNHLSKQHLFVSLG
jgi:hypothetical protein